VKDAVFSGANITEAVAAAGRALGLPTETLRYVVLDPGTAAGPASSGTPARIAVLMDKALPQREWAGARAEMDPRQGIREMSKLIAETGGLEVSFELEETPEALVVQLSGVDKGFFLEENGEVLKALEHLLQRMYGRAIGPKRLVVDSEGYRVSRDASLRSRALQIGESVRKDGTPRTTEPLNAYERRLVHVTIAEQPGLRTFSVGEGANRRVTIALDAEGNRRPE